MWCLGLACHGAVFICCEGATCWQVAPATSSYMGRCGRMEACLKGEGRHGWRWDRDERMATLCKPCSAAFAEQSPPTSQWKEPNAASYCSVPHAPLPRGRVLALLGRLNEQSDKIMILMLAKQRFLRVKKQINPTSICVYFPPYEPVLK